MDGPVLYMHCLWVPKTQKDLGSKFGSLLVGYDFVQIPELFWAAISNLKILKLSILVTVQEYFKKPTIGKEGKFVWL